MCWAWGSAACFLPATEPASVCLSLPPSASAAAAAVPGTGGSGGGDGRGNTKTLLHGGHETGVDHLGVDHFWLARRKRSHAIYRALDAPVRVPDICLVLRSLAQSRVVLHSSSSNSTPCAANSNKASSSNSTADATAWRAGSEHVEELQLECVATLRHMVCQLHARGNACKLILAPGLFWAAVALLHAPARRIYQHALILFENLLRSDVYICK